MLNLLAPTFYLLVLDTVFVCPGVLCYVTNGLIWSKSQQEFINLFSLSWYAKLQNDFLDSTSAVNGNFNGEEIRVGYFQDQNMISFYDNDTKISGIFGDIWNLLADQLNFTLVPVNQVEHDVGGELCNGSHTGLLGLLEQKKIHAIARTSSFAFLSSMLDYTVPVWRNRYRLYIRPQYKLDNKWIITLLSPTTWCCVGCLFLVLSLVGYILQSSETINIKLANAEEQQEFSFFEHVFYTFSLMCSQGYIPSTFYNKHKLLSFTKTIFCWFTLIAFSSHLIYRMTNRILSPPFTDHVSLLNSTKFVLLTFKGSMISDLFEQAVKDAAVSAGIVHIDKRYRAANTPLAMYRKVCFSKKSYAMLEVDDRYMANGRFVCPLIAVGRSYFASWAVLAVSKGFRYKKLFNEVIIKLWEFGILDSLTHRYMGLEQDKTIKNNTFQTIDMRQVYLIFLILGCGAALSFAIFVVEQIIFLNKEPPKKTAIKACPADDDSVSRNRKYCRDTARSKSFFREDVLLK